MITLDAIGHVHSSRKDLSDDDWGDVTARIEIAEKLGPQCLDGLEEFSHAEVIFHFDRVAEGAVVEVAQRRHDRLPAEPPDPTVEEAVRASGDAVAVAVVGIGVREDDGVFDRVEQSEAEQVGGRASPDRGLRRQRLAVDVHGVVERGRGELLDDGAALVAGLAGIGTRGVFPEDAERRSDLVGRVEVMLRIAAVERPVGAGRSREATGKFS